MALLALYSVAVPLTEAADEPSHIDLVFHLADGAEYPSFDGRTLSEAAVMLCETNVASVYVCPPDDEKVAFGTIKRHQRMAATPRENRSTFAELGGDRLTASPNALPQHPPFYYQAMAQVIRLERWATGGNWPFDREVALLRLANVGLVMWLPLLFWRTSRHMGLDSRAGAIAALLPLTIPQLVHIGSVANNDNLLIVLGAWSILLIAKVVRGDHSVRTAVVLGAVTGLAIMSKVTAVMLPFAIAVAYLMSAAPASRLRRIARQLATCGAVTALVSGWWFVSNLMRTGSLTPTIENDRLSSSIRPPGFQFSLPHFVVVFGRLFTERFWGWFGWFSVRIAIATIIVSTTLFLLAIGAGLLSAGPQRRNLMVLLLPALLFMLFVVQHALVLHMRTGLFPFTQGRYLFGAIGGMCVVAAVGLQRVLGRAAVAVVALVALATQFDALRRIFDTYWGASQSDLRDQLQSMVAWSAWSGWLVLVMAFVAILALLALLGAVAWMTLPGRLLDRIRI